MESLLVISDEPALAETLGSELPGLALAEARFAQAPARLRQGHHALIVLDEGGDSGLVPEDGHVPVIRLARPVRLRDLLYTIQERLQGKSAGGKDELPLSETLRFSPLERRLHSTDGEVGIALTEKETELLHCLIKSGGRPMARDAILKEVWGYSDDIATHTLETHIYRLRGKLRQASEFIDVISSDEGGYQLKR